MHSIYSVVEPRIWPNMLPPLKEVNHNTSIRQPKAELHLLYST